MASAVAVRKNADARMRTFTAERCAIIAALMNAMIRTMAVAAALGLVAFSLNAQAVKNLGSGA